ncbi:hypothetical protein H8R18_03640 [Nanchangia anserum]|uniref:hypothetical protein n=1 Tax=Nanchangia anserum TaxID=2692125 RepID=UPI00188464E9|nr:hypothetical protein [Nanchangia anserum]QOX82408.1 hypothetical protein H8R18_03640 [Nanchangia anserum]
MFLAIKEILHQKTRYAAITLVVFLVSYLVYFLTGLAFGLASSYTEVIDTWSAKTVTLAKDANKSALASRLSTSALRGLPEDAAGISFVPAAIDDRSEGADGERINVFIAGVDERLRPHLQKGRWGREASEVVIDPTLERAGWHVGDRLELPEATARIVGVSEPARFQASPRHGCGKRHRRHRRPPGQGSHEHHRVGVGRGPAEHNWWGRRRDHSR